MEGLSAVAISYYALGLLKAIIEGLERLRPGIDPILTTGLAAPVVVLLVWLFLHHIRRRHILHDHEAPA